MCTVPEMGWAGKRNGDLLRRAEREFDAFLAVDRKLQHQQKLSAFNIAVIILVARSNRLVDLHTLVPGILKTLSTASGKASVVGESTAGTN